MKNYTLIQSARAEEENIANKSQMSLGSFIPLILIFVVFYWLIIRPQNKKFKDHQIMINNLKIGSKIVTSGGIYGIIKDIDSKDGIVSIEIADSVIIKIQKNFVNEIIEKKEENSKK